MAILTRQASERRRLTIIGGGPAGLSAAIASSELRPLLLESGSGIEFRDHSLHLRLTEGVGGAGLYSDGKFSFWPSASKLWQLDAELVAEAYSWYQARVSQAGVAIPNLSAVREPAQGVPVEVGRHVEKIYRSEYATLKQRSDLIRSLVNSVGEVRAGTSVKELSWLDDLWHVSTGDGHVFVSDNVILAGGRFGPLLLRNEMVKTLMRFIRVEVGVRIEQDASDFFLRAHTQLDPKLVWRLSADSEEWRTFCCCRDGEVVTTRSGGWTTVSGRADVRKTGRSNVGFNFRTTDEELARRILGELSPTLSAPYSATASLSDFLAESAGTEVHDALGPLASGSLVDGLKRVVQDFPDLHNSAALVHGVGLEGIGAYPVVDRRLRSNLPRLYIAGDSVGSFRGLTAAFVSGYIAGLSVVRDRKS
jgi:uncharacterized FAD-dependent dehydrogenase